MANGYLQVRTLLDNLTQFADLHVAVAECHRQQCSAVFHKVEHAHHLVTVQHYPLRIGDKPVTRNSHTLEPFVQQQVLSLTEEAGTQIVGHAEHEEAVGILLTHLHQIFVLQPVDELLNDNCRTDLCIVHV